MSTSPEQIRPKSSAFSRYLFVLLFGLVLGAVAAVMLLNAWKARQDPFAESLMHVQEWHIKQLGQKASENRCAATDTIPHLKALRTTADDLESAFPGERDDERFVKHASTMRATLDAALSSPPINCEGVNAAAAKIGESCKGCHQDFKG
ncbi:MAG: cytochrome c [Lysobacter sp.]|nr:cytochrome c [Lysobacter sp.]